MNAKPRKRYQVVGVGIITHVGSVDFDWNYDSFDNPDDAEKYILQEKSSHNSHPSGFAIIDFGEYFLPGSNGKIIYIDYRDYCLQKIT